MSSTTFRDWARAEGVENSSPLTVLKGATLAIDADEYIHTVLTNPATREPLLPAHAGLPFSLQKLIDEDLQKFKGAEITPIFVFNGLDPVVRVRAAVSKEGNKATKILNDAWSTYDAGQGDSAVSLFGKACAYKTYHIVRWFQTYLQRSRVRAVTALYNAAPQMQYFVSNDYASAVVGSVSNLVYGAERTIVHFDWEAKLFHWVDTNSCLSKLMLNRDQFVDLILLSGCSVLPPLPEVDLDTPINKINAARNVLTRANNDGHLACLQAKDDDYLEAYKKAKSIVKHPVLVFNDGRIQCKDQGSAPNDVHFFVGQRLPDEVFMYLTRGVIGARVLSWRTRNEVFEIQPLDGGSSQAYRDLVSSKLKPLRSQSLALFTRLLHRYYQKTDVDLVCWFREDDKQGLSVPDLWEDSSTNADSWHLREASIPKSTGADLKESPLTFAIESLSDTAAAKKTVSPRTNGAIGFLNTQKELLSNTIFRFLHDRGYINPDHSLSAWGKAFKAALDRAKEDGFVDAENAREAEEVILLAFELLRLDVLNNKTLFSAPPYSGAPLRGSEADKGHTLLVSRLATLGSLKHSSIGYTGPLSRHLLAYHQMAAAVRNSLRDLVEVHACNLLLSGVVNRTMKPEGYTVFGASLPLIREPDLGLSLVVKSYLDELSSEPSKRTDIAKWFIHALDVEGDLNKAWKMWAAVNAGVQAADSSIINNDVRKLFRTTDEWLQEKIQSGPIQPTNGIAESTNGEAKHDA